MILWNVFTHGRVITLDSRCRNRNEYYKSLQLRITLAPDPRNPEPNCSAPAPAPGCRLRLRLAGAGFGAVVFENEYSALLYLSWFHLTSQLTAQHTLVLQCSISTLYSLHYLMYVPVFSNAKRAVPALSTRDSLHLYRIVGRKTFTCIKVDITSLKIT